MLKLKISKTAFLKIKYYTEGADTEISGLGKVIFQYGDFVVQDAEIFPQEVSAVSSTLNEEALAKVLFEKIKKGESVKEYKFWWHSHVNMHAYFSSIDDRTIDDTTIEGYLISLVTNKKGEMVARLDLYFPLRLTFSLDIELFIEEDNRIKNLCKKEISKKLKTTSRLPWESKPKRISISEDKQTSLILQDTKKISESLGLGLSDLMPPSRSHD